MIKTKCPFCHYGRGRIITCKYGTLIKYDYGSVEKMKSQRDNYCDSMSYKDCQFYKALNKEDR
jgi:hypothetical protein